MSYGPSSPVFIKVSFYGSAHADMAREDSYRRSSLVRKKSTLLSGQVLIFGGSKGIGEGEVTSKDA